MADLARFHRTWPLCKRCATSRSISRRIPLQQGAWARVWCTRSVGGRGFRCVSGREWTQGRRCTYEHTDPNTESPSPALATRGRLCTYPHTDSPTLPLSHFPVPSFTSTHTPHPPIPPPTQVPGRREFWGRSEVLPGLRRGTQGTLRVENDRQDAGPPH